MALLNDFASRFRKGLANPFEAPRLEWCPTCHMQVDHETEGQHQGTTYVYRRRCKRCGSVIARGLFDNVSVLGPPQNAVEWTQEIGADRR